MQVKIERPVSKPNLPVIIYFFVSFHLLGAKFFVGAVKNGLALIFEFRYKLIYVTPSLSDIPQLLRNGFTREIIHELYQQGEEIIVFIILQLAALALKQDSSLISSPSSQIPVYLKKPKRSRSRTLGAKTGWSVEGQTYWLWYFTTSETTYLYDYEKSRTSSD
jgi:hypothetical protein